MIAKEDIESIAGLASMQRGMFFSYAVDTASDAYVEQFDFTGTGELDVERLREALAATSRHYSVLRTVFSFRNTDDPYQVVLRERPPLLEVVDLRGEHDASRAVAEHKTADRARGFDLTRDVLLRASVLWTGAGGWHLVITFHHIILDGWSLGPLFATLFGYYDELVRTGAVRQRHEAHPYRDYLAWYERQRGEDARRHWADVLDGYEQAAVLPTNRVADGYRSLTHRFTLNSGLHAGLKQVAQQARVTQSSVFQAAWGVVLQKFNYSDDVVFGSVVSGRSIDLPGIEAMVGLFVNTQPVRVRTGDGTDFVGLCRAVQEAYARSDPFAYFPLHEIQAGTALKSDLLNHVVAFENYPLAEQLQDFGGDDDDGVRLSGVEVFERTSYDLHVVVNPGTEFAVTFTYNANRYSPDLMTTLQRCLVNVFAAAVANPRTRIRDLAVWTAGTDDAAARPHRPTGPPPLPRTSLVDAFKRTVKTHGDATALIWRGRRYSYRSIDRWSDAVAWQLEDLGAAPGEGIGVLVDRRPELVAAMLGVLKHGNHYVPIDTKDASERIGHVLDDADVRVLCTVPELARQAPDGAELVLVAEPTDGVPEFRGPGDRDGASAYLMYTSGSTGRPKGCHVTHRNVLRLVTDQTFFEFSDQQVILQTSSPAFDACTFEVWGTLLFGATLILPDELDVLDGDRLREVVRQHGVRAMWLTAPLFNRLCDHDPEIFAPLRHLLVGGSALSVPHVATVRRAYPHLRLTNGYGPTENTTFSTTHEIDDQDLLGERVPIGRALNHSTAYVLDRGLNAVPPGAIGELCVGGEGLSSGYHKRPEENRTRFVTAPQRLGERLYRTGDLVRQLPDGSLDYLGRADDQVKVNGYRVELGEVESALRSVEGVRDAAVIAVEHSGDKRLRGYYVAAPGLDADAVRQALAGKLAAYLVPGALVPVEEIPLTRNGKVDRRRLAEIRPGSPADRPARDLRHLSDLERVLHEIVADVLSVDTVDVDRNFFDLGINSLTLLTINARLRKALGRDVPVTSFFEHTSITALAAHLELGDHPPPTGPEETPTDPPDEERIPAQASQLLLLADEPEGTLHHV